jgi:endogenous inhibitor of DNA gyrase (YacG/DUF329 family)
MTTGESTMDTDNLTPALGRDCPVCHSPLPSANPKRVYCSPPCKAEGWRRDHAGDPDRQPIARKTPAPPPPTMLRDCPHCGETVAIVALLATPHVARPDTPNNIR